MSSSVNIRILSFVVFILLHRDTVTQCAILTLCRIISLYLINPRNLILVWTSILYSHSSHWKRHLVRGVGFRWPRNCPRSSHALRCVSNLASRSSDAFSPVNTPPYSSESRSNLLRLLQTPSKPSCKDFSGGRPDPLRPSEIPLALQIRDVR